MAARQKTKPKQVTVSDISDESLSCRDLRHPWQFVTDYTLVREKGAASIITRHLMCPRCTAERFDTFGVPSFMLLSSRTKYPKGYQTRGLKKRTPINEVRREYFSRNYSTRLG